MSHPHLYHSADVPGPETLVCRFCKSLCRPVAMVKPCLECGAYRRKDRLLHLMVRHVSLCGGCGSAKIMLRTVVGNGWIPVRGYYRAPQFMVPV